MKITKTEFFNKLDKIGLLDYLIDYNRNMNYFYIKALNIACVVKL